MGTWGWLASLHRTRRNFAAKPRGIPAAGVHQTVAPGTEPTPRRVPGSAMTRNRVWMGGTSATIRKFIQSQPRFENVTVISETRWNENRRKQLFSMTLIVESSVWGRMDGTLFHISVLCRCPDWIFDLWGSLRQVRNVSFYLNKNNPAVWRYIIYYEYIIDYIHMWMHVLNEALWHQIVVY